MNKSDVKDYSSIPLQLAILSSIILTLVYFCVGFSISDTTLFVAIKSLLLSFVIIIFPILLQNMFKKTYWYYSPGFTDLITLAILVILGIISRLFTLDLSMALAISGFFLFFWFIFRESNSFFKKRNIIQLALFSLCITLMGFIIIGKNFYQANHNATSLYSSLGVDTFFHTAIASMIKIHGIPSTGLDGMPFIHYHWGSHFIFAYLSQLINNKSIDFYLAGYPIIFIPFYIKSLFLAIITLRKYKRIPMQFGVLFFILIITAFMGGLYEIFLSESFLLSSAFLFLLIVTTLIVIENENEQEGNNAKLKLYYWAVLPLLIGLITITKSSNGYFIIGIFFYLFVRLQLYKKMLYLLSFALCGISTLGAIILTKYSGLTTLATIPYEMSYLLYLKTYFYIYHVWTILFIYFFLKYKNISDFSDLKNIVLNKKNMEFEILVITIVLGLLPGFLLNFYNTVDYFVFFQQWIAFALLLTFLPNFIKQIRFDLRFFLRWEVAPTVIILIIILTNASRIYYNTLLVKNYLIHNDKLVVHTQNTLSNDPIENKLLITLQKINNLPLSEKEKTVVYIPKDNTMFWDRTFLNKVDYEKSFVITALSEVPMIYGLPSTPHTRYYDLTSYGKESIIRSDIALSDVIKRARNKGFSQILIIKYDGKNFNIEKQTII